MIDIWKILHYIFRDRNQFSVCFFSIMVLTEKKTVEQNQTVFGLVLTDHLKINCLW